MLSILLQSGIIKEWHVGEKSPVSYNECNAVQDIQIDGHELEYIKNMYPANNPLCIPRNRIVRIFGDLAKTIVANL